MEDGVFGEFDLYTDNMPIPERCPSCGKERPWVDFGLPNSIEKFCRGCGIFKPVRPSYEKQPSECTD